MQGTSNWYCAKCAHFNENVQSACGRCGRYRGSARLCEHQDKEFSLHLLYAAPRSRGLTVAIKRESPPGHAAGTVDGRMPFSATDRFSRRSKEWQPRH